MQLGPAAGTRLHAQRLDVLQQRVPLGLQLPQLPPQLLLGRRHFPCATCPSNVCREAHASHVHEHGLLLLDRHMVVWSRMSPGTQ